MLSLAVASGVLFGTTLSPRVEIKSSTFAKPQKTAISGTIAWHSYFIEITQAPFVKAKHKISREKGTNLILIDGVPPWGMERDSHLLPYKETTNFEVRVDGIKFRFPPEMYRDCYDLHATGDKSFKGDLTRTWEIWLEPNGKTISMSSGASDGGGAYSVIWRISARGGTRFIYKESRVVSKRTWKS